jgi:glycine cleavage system transcriptional repressor
VYVCLILGRMPQLALSAIGRDRPGIVAAVTEALLRHGANVEDSRMAILRGHFTMMLVLSVPDGADVERMRADLDAAASRLELEALALSPVEPLAQPAPEPTHMVTVYGVDHPGIVHRASRTLADLDVSITDLQTRLVEEGGEPSLYALLMEVALPAGLDPDAVGAALDEAGAREDVEVSLRELERDEL